MLSGNILDEVLSEFDESARQARDQSMDEVLAELLEGKSSVQEPASTPKTVPNKSTPSGENKGEFKLPVQDPLFQKGLAFLAVLALGSETKKQKKQFQDVLFNTTSEIPLFKQVLAGGGVRYAIREDGASALHFAVVGYFWQEKIQLLLKAGFNVNYCHLNKDDPIGGVGTAFHVVIANEAIDRANALLDAAAKSKQAIDYGLQDGQGKTVLLLAIRVVKPALVKTILQEILKCQNAIEIINKPDQEGRTALHYACALGLAEIVTLLLQAGADPKITDRDGKTAAQFADLNKEGVNRILESIGIDPERHETAKQNSVQDELMQMRPRYSLAEMKAGSIKPTKVAVKEVKALNHDETQEVLICQQNKNRMKRIVVEQLAAKNLAFAIQLRNEIEAMGTSDKSISQKCFEGHASVKLVLSEGKKAASFSCRP